MDHEPNEYELARRAGSGDRDALSELIERARLRLFALAYHELGHYEDAQDAVAASFLRICRHIDELREPARIRAWMHTVVRNEARRLKHRAGDPATLQNLDGAPAADGEASLLRLDIELTLRRLPRDQGRAIALFYLEGLPLRDIARLTGRPEGTIKRWLHLGRRQLATEMEDYAPMAATPTEPMTQPVLKAAIISTDLDTTLLQQMIDALKDAGFGDATVFDGATPVTEERLSADGKRESHLAAPLEGKQFILLDEWLGGRSAFEVHTVLKALPALNGTLFGLLALSPCQDQTAYAAWLAGFYMLLTKPFGIDEFAGLIRGCICKKLKDPSFDYVRNSGGS
jgi:RNA polymerase sigma factor (sigma-70 family)